MLLKGQQQNCEKALFQQFSRGPQDSCAVEDLDGILEQDPKEKLKM